MEDLARRGTEVDNEQLGRMIKDAINDAKTEIRVDVARIEGQLTAHQRDAYAHREMVAGYAGEQRDWNHWRGKVDTRFAYLTGGLAVLTFAVSIFGAAIFQHIFH